MKLSDYDYELPALRIAQRPLAERDASRLLLVHRGDGRWEDRRFAELPELLRGDELMVVNNARVIPARLFARRKGVSAQPPGKHSRTRREHLKAPVEVLLTRQLPDGAWEALVRPGRKVAVGERLLFGNGELQAEVVGRGQYGLRQLRFEGAGNLLEALERLGHVPLPPYIRRPDEPADRERYQTIFATRPGAVATPTAGLHFTPEICERLRQRGVGICEITLQVGLGTFQPIRAVEVEDHVMHSEPYEISEAAAAEIEQARRQGRPVLAVGTTVVRALEDSARKALGGGKIVLAGQAEADLFIYPGFRFRVVDQMLTNFHLPKSSLLLMVCAFAGRELLLRAYQHALEQGYRFYSYGDCMLIR